MKITAISVQIKNPNRVNISIDGVYRFSLDISQVVDLNIKIGREINNEELTNLQSESEFGKLYTRGLEYSLLRPHSSKEVKDYLYRKTLSRKYKSNKTGEIKEKRGVDKAVANRVFDKLLERGYIDDEKFARWWVESRNIKKGSSLRKLRNELISKGVDGTIIENVISQSSRNDTDELQKIIAKKRKKYQSDDKLIKYLVSQGFNYYDVRQAVDDYDASVCI